MKKYLTSLNRQNLFIITVLSLMLVFGATKAFAALTFSSTAITGTDATTIDVGAGNTLSLQTTNNGNVLFGTGKVGIGTTPAAMLHILGTTEQFRLGYDASSYWSGTVASDGGLTFLNAGTDGDINFDLSGATDGDFSVNTDDLFVDTSTGRVGIGEITPTAVLHLKAGTATAAAAPLKFTPGTINTTPESGAMEYDGSSLYFTQAAVRRFVTLGNDIRVTDTVVTNTTTETTIHTSTIAADELKAGKMYKVTLLGKTTTSDNAQYFTLRFKMGGTTLITVPMLADNVSDDHFKTEAYITIRTIGASGTYAAHVEGTIGDQVISATPVTGSVDTTVVQDMVTTLQWNEAKALNTFTIMQAVLEVVG
ncbi:MAG: hypothetical protein WD509_03050 [Candidatus Paceibacterota bacterium]